MAELDPGVTPASTLAFVEGELIRVQHEISKNIGEKTDEENVAYYAGQMDILEQFHAFLTT